MRGRFAIGVVVAATGALLLAGSASAINSVTCGSTIKSPGSYKLKGDCSGAGIRIKASNVTLDLARHTMTGNNPNVMSVGVYFGDVGNIRILGPGVIKNYFAGLNFGETEGIYVGNVTLKKNSYAGAAFGLTEGVTFDGTMALNNGSYGFLVNTTLGTVFDHVQANGNPYDGIRLEGSDQALVTGGQMNGNGDYGVDVVDGSHSNTIHNTSAFGNGNDDLFDGNAACDSNSWYSNTFGTANQGCIG